ncbi:MAG: hypothetical protein DCC71_23030, partial [Proteobacteria bacterium]
RALAAPRRAVANEAQPGGAPRSRSLPRRIERREIDPDERARPGPFVLPFGDPHLSVQDAAGVERPTDQGEEEDLDALAEELAAQAEVAVVRSDAPVREVLETDAAAAPAAAAPATPSGDAATRAWRYPEWDCHAQAYRAGAATVHEALAPAGDPGWAAAVRAEHAALLLHLRRRFEALRPRLRRVPRRVEGDDIDLDGWVDEWADRHAGRTPDGRIYTQVRPRRRDVAVALLVDVSGSTDAWVAGRVRVVDVAKQAALCFCVALGALGDRHCVDAFSGRGAHGVRSWTVKSFAEPLSDTIERRIAGLAPDSSTRLGAALRHVAARLVREPAHTRLLLLLSDGKPWDEDGYEGVYGVEDARQAVAEARAAGVRVFCAAIDRTGPAHLPRVFGPSGYAVIRDVAQIPAWLPELHRQLTL